MDTSETYIKMCEKAEEIQAQRKDSYTILSGDVINLRDGHTVVVGSDSNMFYWNIAKPAFIWLPRQDQLQEMWLISFPGRLIVEEFYAWFKNLTCHPEFTSMEQLWLAFVMKEKYNKVWNGEDWK